MGCSRIVTGSQYAGLTRLSTGSGGASVTPGLCGTRFLGHALMVSFDRVQCGLWDDYDWLRQVLMFDFSFWQIVLGQRIRLDL